MTITTLQKPAPIPPLPWLLDDYYKNSVAELVVNMLWSISMPTGEREMTAADRHVYERLLDASEFLDEELSPHALSCAQAALTSALNVDIPEGGDVPRNSNFAAVLHRLINFELARIANQTEGALA